MLYLDFSGEAKKDLHDIFRYLRPRNAKASAELQKELTHFFKLLVRNPLMGKAVPEFGPGLRSFPIGNYVCFYQVIEDTIEVVRVVHGARDLVALFEPD